MRLRLPGDTRTWGKYAAELLIVAAGVALGLWATEWAAARKDAAEVRDASRALHDELTDNFETIQYRKQAEPCIRRRIADLRQWISRQQAGDRTPLPGEIGRPGGYAVLDSVWDVSKAGEVAAKMPLEQRRRYAAIYDVLEGVRDHQRAERDIWFELNEFAGRSGLSAAETARLKGLLWRAEATDESLSTNHRTLLKDLALLGIHTADDAPAEVAGRRALCAPWTD